MDILVTDKTAILTQIIVDNKYFSWYNKLNDKKRRVTMNFEILDRFKRGEFDITDSTHELIDFLCEYDFCYDAEWMINTTVSHVDFDGKLCDRVLHGKSLPCTMILTAREFMERVLKDKDKEKGEIKMTEKDLKVLDLVSHEDGTLQMVVKIDGEMGFSLLDGCGNGFYGNPFEYNWGYGDIVKIWRPKNRGYFGTFLSRLNIADLNIADYFDLVWERKSEAQIELEKAKELLREAHEAVEKAEEKLAKERGM
jgi:hypothetical protein